MKVFDCLRRVHTTHPYKAVSYSLKYRKGGLELKKFSCIKLWNYLIDTNDIYHILKEYDIKTLEILAIELYEKEWYEIRENPIIPKSKLDEILNEVLYVRCSKLNSKHTWTEKDINEILRVSDLFVTSFEKAVVYANKIKNNLQNKKNKNIFLMDFEIEIKLSPYLSGYEAVEDDMSSYFMYVLCEPIVNKYYSVLTVDIRHEEENKKYYDKSEIWRQKDFDIENIEALSCFRTHFISYAIHELLDTKVWSFQDIISINRICAEVLVMHQSFFGEYE
jgi:hypothetical protein